MGYPPSRPFGGVLSNELSKIISVYAAFGIRKSSAHFSIPTALQCKPAVCTDHVIFVYSFSVTPGFALVEKYSPSFLLFVSVPLWVVGEVGIMILLREAAQSSSDPRQMKTTLGVAFVLAWLLGDMLVVAAWRHKSLEARSKWSCSGTFRTFSDAVR